MPIRDVGDAMNEMKGGSRFIKTRPQAIAVGLKQERKFGGDKSGKRPPPFGGRQFGKR
jgi:hypothetical protein